VLAAMAAQAAQSLTQTHHQALVLKAVTLLRSASHQSAVMAVKKLFYQVALRTLHESTITQQVV
jgi:hypothetical protein